MSGLLAGLKASFFNVQKFVTNATKLIKGAGSKGLISGSTESALTKWLRKDNAKLRALSKQRTALAKKISAAKDYAKQVRSDARSFADITNVAQAGVPVTGGLLNQGLQSFLAKIRSFGSDIKTLKKMGLNATTIGQLVAAGPDQGDLLAQAIIKSGNVSAINKTQKSITSATKSLGTTAANSMYDTGKNAGGSLVSGLKSKESAITKEMKKIAKAMIKTLRKELKIGSPSKVTREIGRWAGAGIPQGISLNELATRQAAQRLATAAIPKMARGSAAGRGGGGLTTVQVFIGNEQLTGRIDARVSEYDRGTASKARAGTGRNPL
jgi:seryl-tRNA synthetase